MDHRSHYRRACAPVARDDSTSSLPCESATTSGARCSLPRAAEAAPTLNPTWRSPRWSLRRSTGDARAVRRQSAGFCPLVREIVIPPMGEDAVSRHGRSAPTALTNCTTSPHALIRNTAGGQHMEFVCPQCNALHESPLTVAASRCVANASNSPSPDRSAPSLARRGRL